VLFRWIEKGRAAFQINSEEALVDSELVRRCKEKGRCLILADEILLADTKPGWLSWFGVPGATLLQTLQTRRLPLRNPSFIPGARSYLIPTIGETESFVDNLLKFDAGFSSDREAVSRSFLNGLYGEGGLWSAAYEATRGQPLNDRIGDVVEEFFTLHPEEERYALAAVSFLNVALEYSGRNPEHSRLSVQPTRSRLKNLVISHPHLSPSVASGSAEQLKRFGATLAGEFIGSGGSPDYLDTLANPVFEFRSASATHAFNRWIFGALSAEGRYRIPRWPWFVALADSLRNQAESKRSVANFVSLLRLLVDAWDLKPHVRLQSDHGRSNFDVSKIAQHIHDQARHFNPNPVEQCRLDAALGEAFAIGANEPCASAEEVEERTGAAAKLFKAATGKDSPSDVLMSIALYVSRKEVRSLLSDEVDWKQLMDRAIESASTPEAKVYARYSAFKTYILRTRARLNKVMVYYDASFTQRLGRDERLLDIVHGMIDAADRSEDQLKSFLEGGVKANDLKSACSVFRFAVMSLASNKVFLEHLSEAIDNLGPRPHNTANSIIHGLLAVIRLVSRQGVPFREEFGAEADELRKRINDAIGERDYRELYGFLLGMNHLLRSVPLTPPPSATPR